MKIDAEYTGEEAEMDTSDSDEGVNFDGFTEGIQTYSRKSDEESLKFSFSLDYSTEIGKFGKPTVSLVGNLDFEIKPSLQVSLYLNHFEVLFSIDTTVNAEIAFEAEKEIFDESNKFIEQKLGTVKIPAFTGVAIVTRLSYVIEANASLTLSKEHKFNLTFFYDGEKFNNISKKYQNEPAYFKFAGEIFMGVKMFIGISVFSGVLEIGFEGKVGPKFTGSIDNNPYHTCKVCFSVAMDTTMDWEFTVNKGIIFKELSEDVDLKFKFCSIEVREWKIYISELGCGLGDCPNYVYNVVVNVVDKDGLPIEGADVNGYFTDSKGNVNISANKGKFEISVEKSGYNTRILDKEISEMQVITVVLLKPQDIELDSSVVGQYGKVISSGVCNYYGTVEYKLYDTGLLYIYGDGDEIEYSPWDSSDVKRIVIDGYFYECIGWFGGYSNLVSVVIGDNVRSINYKAFEDCTNLTSVVIGNSVTSIGKGAFEGCDSLTSVTIPDSVTSIGEWAFAYCSSLTSVVIGNSVRSIYDYAFYNCSSLTSVTIPASVMHIMEAAFSSCSSLTSVTIGDSVIGIGYYAFRGCSSLTSVTIPDSVTSIGEGAFFLCSSLTSVTIPDSVTSIGDSAFNGCSSLADVYYGGTKIQWQLISIGSYNTYLSNANIIYSEASGKILLSGACGVDLTFTLDDVGILKISGKGDMTNYSSSSAPWYSACEAIEKVIIEDGVTSIGGYAFEYCTNITSVLIPDSVVKIGECAFYQCSSLESLKLGNNIKTIARNAFSRCSNLESVIIPESVKSIGSSAFGECTSLKYVKLGSGLKTIGTSSFRNCASLETVTIPKSVTYLGDGAFYGCASMGTATIGDGIVIINNETFFNCDSLTDVYYTGSEEQWEKIVIASDNDPLWLATLHFCAHTYSEWLKNDELSDEDNALYERTCTECGFTEFCIMCNHKFEVVTVTPTSTTKGSKSKICEKCGELLESVELDIIPEKIIIRSLPTKLTYSYGDALDLTGLLLSYSYADGREDVILTNSDYTVNCFDAYSFGIQTLLIETENYKASFDVTVDLKTAPIGFSQKIEAGATVSDLAELYPDATVCAVTADGKKTVGDTEILKTGMILQIMNSDGTADGLTVIVNGDVTGDGIVNGKDIIRIKKQINSGNAVEYIEYADVNSDGIVNEDDITALMQF